MSAFHSGVAETPFDAGYMLRMDVSPGSLLGTLSFSGTRTATLDIQSVGGGRCRPSISNFGPDASRAASNCRQVPFTAPKGSAYNCG
jgi:hypothetical protein